MKTLVRRAVRSRLLHFVLGGGLWFAVAPERAERPQGNEPAKSAPAARTPAHATVDLVFVDKDRVDARTKAEDARLRLARGERVVVDTPPVAARGTWTEDALARSAGRAVADAAFRTPVGETSGPVASTWGFFVVRPLARVEEARVD